jgi:hypothetical protein
MKSPAARSQALFFVSTFNYSELEEIFGQEILRTASIESEIYSNFEASRLDNGREQSRTIDDPQSGRYMT